MAFPATYQGRKPRVVRNFWVDAQIDGRQTALSGGPTGAGGGFDLTIKQRDVDGDGNVMVTTAYEIMGRADGNELKLFIRDAEGNLVDFNITDRTDEWNR